MGKINVLDIQVANLIAAGEVVDRPASVVKELLENAIDASSRAITVEIKRGGVSFIRVSDDGIGMSAEDLPVSIKRHATSKIQKETDLDGIITLGFRGEALAAISSVSKMRIMTRQKDNELGFMLESEAGQIKELTETGCQKGTTVIVEELFANIPARRKFLKRDVSEAMACSAVVEKIALSRPDISIKFISDGNMKFNTSGDGKLINTIYAVLGREFAVKLIEVKSLTENIEVYGFIGRPDNVRANRNFQNFFINGRYVKSLTAMSALEQAYDSYIPSDKFPPCVLNINIHPAFVDVNVHPTKLEVKFSDEKTVFDAIYCAVRNTLTQKLKHPDIKIEPNSISIDDIKLQNAFVPIYDRTEEIPNKRNEQAALVTDANPVWNSGKSIRTEFRENPVSEINSNNNNKLNTIKNEINNPASPGNTVVNDISKTQVTEVSKTNYEDKETSSTVPEYKIIGEAFNSYVIVELKDKILMIDKHAAHERIIFEELKQKLKNKSHHGQILLVPIELMFDYREYAAICEYEDDIKIIGFDFDRDDDKRTLSIKQIPSELNSNTACDMLTVLGEQLSTGTGKTDITRDIFYEKALYQASCKAAIKAGHIESMEHIRWICDRVLALPDIKYCPHGRPIAFELTKSEMEKQFKRT